ncbi:MAG TPA: hypothetical protein VNN20_15100 [Thermodesulfobacteriota bacterium]|nr:hypothetical protein [Thermodesulfobacteriota bacterium]
MSTETNRNETLEQIFADLESKIRNGSITKDDFGKGIKELKANYKKLQSLLEWAKEAKPQDKGIYRLYKQVSYENTSDLAESLRKYGYSLVTPSEKDTSEQSKKKNELKEVFVKRQGYRLMELTRLGKRDEVFYGLLRIFWSFKLQFRLDLAEAFKPVYSDELFKVLILSFLSGVLGEQEE